VLIAPVDIRVLVDFRDCSLSHEDKMKLVIPTNNKVVRCKSCPYFGGYDLKNGAALKINCLHK